MFFGHFLCYTGGVNKGNGAFSGSPVKAGESMQMLNLLYGILIAAGIIVPLFSLLLGTERRSGAGRRGGRDPL